MLPDFPIPVQLGQELRLLLARDVPAHVFFYGFPNSFPGAECFQKVPTDDQRQTLLAYEVWKDDLLIRIVVKPSLTPELVQRLGDGAKIAQLTYLHTIGWNPDPAIMEHVPEPDVDALPWLEEPSRPALKHQIKPYTKAMAPNIRLAVIEIAKAAGVLPSVIWGLPISEFIFNWRTLIQPGLIGGFSQDLPPEFQAIGVESA